jgi:hypothetical protein
MRVCVCGGWGGCGDVCEWGAHYHHHGHFERCGPLTHERAWFTAPKSAVTWSIVCRKHKLTSTKATLSETTTDLAKYGTSVAMTQTQTKQDQKSSKSIDDEKVTLGYIGRTRPGWD